MRGSALKKRKGDFDACSTDRMREGRARRGESVRTS